MVATYDPNLRVTEQGTNDNPNTWGSVLNQQVIALLSTAIAGVTQIDFSGGSDIDISTSTLIPPNNQPGVANGAVDTARNMILELTSTITPLTGTLNLILPAVQKLYLINAKQTGGSINVKCSGGSSFVTFTPGMLTFVYTNGTNIYQHDDNISLLAANNLSDLVSKSAARTNLGLGTSATLNVGTGANQIVQLDGSAKLPAIDGSQLLNVTGTPAGVGTAAYLNVGTAAGNIPQLNGSAQLPAVDGSLLTNLPKQLTVTAANPWKIVAGGLTIQGGTTSAGSEPYTGTFPTAFSNTPYGMWFTATVSSASTTTTSPAITALSSTGYKIVGQNIGGSSNFYWLAVGPT